MIKKPETSDLVAGLLCCAYEGHPENKTHVLFSLCMLYVYFLFSARDSFTTEGLFYGVMRMAKPVIFGNAENQRPSSESGWQPEYSTVNLQPAIRRLFFYLHLTENASVFKGQPVLRCFPKTRV